MWKHSIIAVAALGSLLGFSSTDAIAFTLPSPPALQTNASPLLIDVRSRGGRHYNGGGNYNRYHGGYRRHGYGYCNSWNNRCGYNNHYNNWYGNPGWVLGGIGLGFGLGYGAGYYNNGYYGDRYYGGYGNRHVAWCLNRYRSYNPRTNTWVSYSGRVYQCRSPYRY